MAKGKGIAAAAAPPQRSPDPAVKCSEFWNRGDAAHWGYPSIKEFLKDDVFKLNLILNGGWTKDTMPILPELVEQALDQKAWNRRYGHISFSDRRDYYVRRAARFKTRVGASDEAHSRERDAPALTDAEEREMQVRNLGKGKGIAAASAAPRRKPDPAVKYSEFWNRGDTARWGYPSMREFLEDQADANLPYQRGAPRRGGRKFLRCTDAIS